MSSHSSAEEFARKIRRSVVEMCHLGKSSHVGAALSMADIVAVLYSLVLVTLDNVQEDLEDPFDEIGTDDVKLDIIEDYRPIITS